MMNADTDRALLKQEAAAHERLRLESLVAGDRSGLATLMSEVRGDNYDGRLSGNYDGR